MMSRYKTNISRPVLVLGWTNIKLFPIQVHRRCMKKLELFIMSRYKVNISRPVLALGWTNIKKFTFQVHKSCMKKTRTFYDVPLQSQYFKASTGLGLDQHKNVIQKRMHLDPY